MKELLNTGVNLPLEYDADNDALIGQVKGYSIAIKENLETGSYGCLMWVREGEFSAITTAEEYLTEHQMRNPDLMKKFRVTEQGVAVALNRVNDDFTNVNNLKRFAYDFANGLSLNFYKNCCCECGKAENLGIYSADGVIAQACAECGAKYKLIREFGKKEGKSGGDTFAGVSGSAADDLKNRESNIAVSRPVKTEEPVSFVQNLSDIGAYEALKEEAVSSEPRVPAAESFADAEPVEVKQEIDIFEEAKKVPVTEITESLDALLIEDENEEKHEASEIRLLEKTQPEYAEEELKIEEENIYSYDNKAGDLLIDDEGDIILKEITSDDSGLDVVEIRDDSNDGEDFDIEEIESTVTKATVTTGHPQLTAEETPLEEDGSVPLINPNSHREERHVSPVDGPDAVQPLETSRFIISEDVNQSDVSELAPGYASGDSMGRNADSRSTSAVNKKVKFVSRSNAFMGIIGALVFGFVGTGIWVLVANYLNVISYWGCLAVVICVFIGYVLAGKSMDKKGVVISFLLTLLMVFAGVVTVAGLNMTEWIEETYYVDATFFDGVDWLVYAVKNSADVGEFLTNLVVSLLITFVADIIVAINVWKKA